MNFTFIFMFIKYVHFMINITRHPLSSSNPETPQNPPKFFSTRENDHQPPTPNKQNDVDVCPCNLHKPS